MSVRGLVEQRLFDEATGDVVHKSGEYLFYNPTSEYVDVKMGPKFNEEGLIDFVVFRNGDYVGSVASSSATNWHWHSRKERIKLNATNEKDAIAEVEQILGVK